VDGSGGVELSGSATAISDIVLSVGVALRYRLEDLSSMVRFLAGAGNFSLHHRVQNSSRTDPASYPMYIRCSFRGGKAAGA
jgi:hypothetical protein